MQITLNVKKRETFIIVAVLLLLSAFVYAGSYISSTTKKGHDTDEIGSGAIAGDLNITGTVIAKSDIILDSLPSSNLARNLTALVCSFNSTYCTG
jgi:hypothetical protein